MRRGAIAALTVGALAASAAPAMGIRFAVKGDWGSGFASQAEVTARMCTEYARARFVSVLTTGDNFYPTGTATPDTFDKPEKCLIDLRIPYRAAWGNHDAGGGPSTRTVLKTPNRWYTFVSGPARIVVLDSNQPDSTRQLTFLRRVLEAEKVRPVVVTYHHGTRTAGLHEPITKQQRLWEPLFVKHRVRLVLQGHNHLYERIRYKDVTYVTTGGGGAGLYPCVRKTPGLVTCKPENHFLLLEVTPTKIGVRAIDTKGTVIDRFRITLTPPAP